jgi:hypothetical protein
MILTDLIIILDLLSLYPAGFWSPSFGSRNFLRGSIPLGSAEKEYGSFPGSEGLLVDSISNIY